MFDVRLYSCVILISLTCVYVQAMMQMQQSMQQLQSSGLMPPIPGMGGMGGMGQPPAFNWGQGAAAGGAGAGATSIGGLDFSAMLRGAGAGANTG